MFWVRKIERAKWHRPDWLAAEEIPADAITKDLKTDSNMLSIWEGGEQGDAQKLMEDRPLKDAVLILGTQGNKIDNLTVAWVPENELRNNLLTLEKTGGNTTIKNFRDRHTDITKLDYQRLGRVAGLFAMALTNEHRWYRLTKKQVLHIIEEALSNNVITKDDLTPEIVKIIEQQKI